jgi:hypothetical protein
MYEMEGPRSVSLHRRAQPPKRPRGRAFATSALWRSRTAIGAGFPVFSLPTEAPCGGLRCGLAFSDR